MPGFTAATANDDYAYDFTDAAGPKGRIPMPSTEAVRKFREALYAAETAVTGIEVDSVTTEEQATEYSKRLALLTSAERDRLFDGNLDAVAGVCDGHPTREEIDALPMPVKVGFVNHVMELLRPLF